MVEDFLCCFKRYRADVILETVRYEEGKMGQGGKEVQVYLYRSSPALRNSPPVGAAGMELASQRH